jgi:hypothetical protein
MSRIQLKSASLNSDDEYHYSDLEEEYAGDIPHEDEEDEEDYQYSDDNSVCSDNGITPTGTTSPKRTSRSLGSPVGASKKHRMRSSVGTHSVGESGGQEEYRVIEEQELLAEEHRIIHEISQVLEVPPGTAAILLRFYGWNKEKLFEGYYSNPLQAKKDAGIEFLEAPLPGYPENTQVFWVRNDFLR